MLRAMPKLSNFFVAWALSASFLAFETESTPPRAATVLMVGKDPTRISVSHQSGRPWPLRQKLCIWQQKQLLECGTVVHVGSKGAIVQLGKRNRDILLGDLVLPEGEQVPANADSELLETYQGVSRDGSRRFYLGLGGAGSLRVWMASLSFQFLIAPHVGIGIHPVGLYSFDETGITAAAGGLVSVNFFSDLDFRGLWLQLAGGPLLYFAASGTGVESGPGAAGQFTVGWRWGTSWGLCFGFGAGAKYLSEPGFLSVRTNSSGFGVLGVLDVGFYF